MNTNLSCGLGVCPPGEYWNPSSENYTCPRCSLEQNSRHLVWFIYHMRKCSQGIPQVRSTGLNILWTNHHFINVQLWVHKFTIILIWFDLIWFDLIWFDLVWFGLVWFGLVWFGLDWFDFNLISFHFISFHFIWYPGDQSSTLYDYPLHCITSNLEWLAPEILKQEKILL